MEKKTVAVLFGGVSSEHDVSLISVTSVLQHIPTDRYDIIKVGITMALGNLIPPTAPHFLPLTPRLAAWW